MSFKELTPVHIDTLRKLNIPLKVVIQMPLLIFASKKAWLREVKRRKK